MPRGEQMAAIAIAKPILKIREVIKDIQFDAVEENVPQAVLKRFLHCVADVTD